MTDQRMTDQQDRYAVTGYPVSHSRSPFIHAMFAEQTGQAMCYDRLEVAPEDFEQAIQRFFAEGGKGLNVTVPHKEAAWRLVSRHAPNAALAGAVNTLYQENGELIGDNTDGVGMVRDIEQNHGGQLTGASIVILGAGGAVRGVLPRLLVAQPRAITIVNRTVARAQALVEQFAGEVPIAACSYEQLAELHPAAAGWVINGSAAGLQGELPPLPDTLVDSATGCYDMVYAQGGTVFQKWARTRGAALALDGSGMLVEQAAESFRIWRGVTPDTAPVLKALRSELGIR